MNEAQAITNRKLNIREIEWTIFLYSTGLSESLGLISIPLFGTAELRLRDFIFFLPLISLVRNGNVLKKKLQIFVKKSRLSVPFLLFYLSLLLGVIVGFVRGNQVGLILGDFRGILFLLIGAICGILIAGNTEYYFKEKKLIRYCLLSCFFLLIQMYVLKDHLVIFNFHQEVYDGFINGYGRYILPLGGLIFAALFDISLLKILLFKKGMLFKVFACFIFVVAIFGSQSRSLITVTFFVFAILISIYFLSKKSIFFYSIITVAAIFFLISPILSKPSNSDNSFQIAGRSLPTFDFLTDPDSYQYELPETYDRWDQHIDAYDYIVQNKVAILGAGAGIKYRTPTFDYLTNKATKKDNYLTFSDGGFPYVLAKDGFIGLAITLIFLWIIVRNCISTIKLVFLSNTFKNLLFAIASLYCVLLFPFVNPIYANDIGFLFGLFTTIILFTKKSDFYQNSVLG